MIKYIKLFLKFSKRNTHITKNYDSIPQVVFKYMTNEKHIFFNKVWFDYIGLHKEKSSPMLWKEYFHPEDLMNFMNLLILNINLSELECKCRILNKSGDYRWHLIRILPKINVCFGTATDIHDFILREQAQSSQHAIEVRNEFLSMASHELNTPITSLKLHLQLLKKALPNADQLSLPIEKFSKSIDVSVNQVDRLILLVQDLLNVSNIQSKKLNFNYTECNTGQIINEVLGFYKDDLTKLNCHFEIDYPTDLKICWDKKRIIQVFLNLINNAVKYAPGKIVISVKEENNFILIKIKDFGKGIQKEKLHLVFDKYERATSNLNISGLGMGLFIAKQIVEGHQGKIQVDSKFEEGTCFTITLPKNIDMVPTLASSLA